VRSLLKIRELHETVRLQAAELADWNKKLEERVERQVAQLHGLERLKRFFSPQLAEAILGDGMKLLEPHRRLVTVVFVDLRGFTPFAQSAEPEEVMDVLAQYHAEMGCLIMQHHGTLERFTGDGLMIFFNDPMEVPNPEESAVRMAVAMQGAAAELKQRWMRYGWDLGFGIGITSGYATLGAIGFEGRWDYAAIGTVTNQAARLCGVAEEGQILVADRVLARVEEVVEAVSIGELTLKGLSDPVRVHNVVGMRS
jgi:class 3 adenylate cyclase